MLVVAGGELNVSDRVGRAKILSRVAPGNAASAFRYVAAGLAFFALYLQLAAAGLSAVTLPALAASASANFDALTVCQGRNNDKGSTQKHGAPTDRQCAFCPAYCHAFTSTALLVKGLDGIYIASTSAEHVDFVVPAMARFPAGAPPRGPPASI